MFYGNYHLHWSLIRRRRRTTHSQGWTSLIGKLQETRNRNRDTLSIQHHCWWSQQKMKRRCSWEPKLEKKLPHFPSLATTTNQNNMKREWAQPHSYHSKTKAVISGTTNNLKRWNSDCNKNWMQANPNQRCSDIDTSFTLGIMNDKSWNTATLGRTVKVRCGIFAWWDLNPVIWCIFAGRHLMLLRPSLSMSQVYPVV